jgi:hypothetical protein
MELLRSVKFEIPKLFFIEDRNEIKDIPIGVPFIYGNNKDKKRIIRMLEYEVIWKAAIKSGFPFNFKKLLQEAGFENVDFLGFCESFYIDHKDTGDYDIDKIDSSKNEVYSHKGNALFDKLVEDCSAYVDINVLKNLKVFPTWLDDIETAIETNIYNFATYNPNMYNKKLDGMYGGIDMQSPSRNLIVIDISGSIPRAVGTTCLILARHLVETFYADLMITGSKTFLFPYEEIHSLDIEGLYDSIGRGNESSMYRALVTGESRKYNTAIVFGDYHSPCDSWDRGYSIGREDAKKMCTWQVTKMISLHTTNNKARAGYGDFFDVEDVQYVQDWVKYIKQY